MHFSQANLLLRDDTFLGICEGLGQDFGFNPLWLRLAFAALLLFNPTAVIGTYLGLGLIVALSRLIYPNVRNASAVPVRLAREDVEHSQSERFAVAA